LTLSIIIRTFRGNKKGKNMAYMNQEKKKRIAPQIKEILKRHNMKGSLSVDNYSTLRLTLREGPIDFKYTGQDGRTIRNINEYWYEDHFKDNPTALAFLSEVIPAMNNGNHDNSDIMTDYFDVGWYISVNLGRWDKPYAVNN
tara:strand:- start:142 stop:567 length:426 start_codon:yes stop_codon:yes gene_type:complete